MTIPLIPSPSPIEEPTAATAQPPAALSPAPSESEPTLRFPVDWLLANASAPLQYRAINDVVGDVELAGRLAPAPLAYPPALTLALTQTLDGTWSGTMLTLPGPRAQHFNGVGTVNAVRRLTEYGWPQESPPIHQARRPLFRLLAEDERREVLYEFGGRMAGEEEMVRRGRAILRDAAAAALGEAGFEADPRLRGAGRRILMRAVDYLRSPLAQKPFVRVGNQHVLAPEAAPPSIYGLAALARIPSFRTEFHDEMDRLYEHLAQPLPRTEPVQLCGSQLVPQPQLVLGDLLASRHASDADLPWTLHWLELMARLGFLRRNEGWMKLYERLLDQCDAHGVWKPNKHAAPPHTSNPYAWHMWPLGDGIADVTFRLGLIGKLLGREIELA